MRQHAIQVERVGHLAGEERVKVVEVDSPRQEIGVPSPELARARPRQQEAKADRPLVEQHLHEIEEGRDPLHLVEEDRAHVRARRSQLRLQALRPRDVLAKGRRTGQVHREVGPERVEERRLADLAGAEKEDAAPVRGEVALSTRSNTWVK